MIMNQSKNDLRFAPTQGQQISSAIVSSEQPKIDALFLKWLTNEKFTVLEPLKIHINPTQSRLFLCERNGQYYVLQVFINKHNEPSQDVIKKIQKIQSPYLQTWYETGRKEGYFYLVTDYFSDGDASLLVNHSSNQSDLLKHHLIPQMNEALRLLHSQNIVHRDVKLTNILMNLSTKTFVLADYGIAKDIKDADFIESKDQAFTDGFSAPEADRIIRKSNDYFSFGRVLEYLASKANPDAGRTQKNIAMENELGLGKISNTIDPEIADLIAILKVVDSNKRAGYNEIEQWIKRPSQFDGRRFLVLSSLDAYAIKNPLTFLNQVYDNLGNLTEAWCQQWEKASFLFSQMSDVYHNELFKDLFPQWSAKQRLDFQQHFKRAQKLYQKDSDAVFFSCILFINPKQRFHYRGFNLGGIKGLVNYIVQNPQQIKAIPFPNELLKEVLNAEIKHYDPKAFMNFFNALLNDDMDSLAKKSLLYSYFKEYSETNPSFMIDGHFFKNKEAFTDFLFNEEGEPVDSPTLRSKLFFDWLVNRFGWSEEQVNLIASFDDLYQRNAELSKSFVGHIDFSRGKPAYKFYYFNNFVEYAAIDYAKPKLKRDLFVAHYIKKGLLRKFIQFSNFSADQENVKKELLKRLQILEKKIDLNEILVEFFQYTSQSKFFIYEGEKFYTIQDIVNFLAKSKQIEADSESLIHSAEFKVWWEAKGFPHLEKGDQL